mmetsp:Transcript_12455/g.41022  ORF Transcript_12455/g.41022 Transcript_12455/m.41022 type:complete len:772 (+) Transcript_12455:49-2364(+)
MEDVQEPPPSSVEVVEVDDDAEELTSPKPGTSTAVGASEGGASEATKRSAPEPGEEAGPSPGGGSRKRRKTPSAYMRLTDAEENLLAECCGLNYDDLAPEEFEYLPAGASDVQYLTARNHILAKWRTNVATHMTEAEATSGIQKQCKKLALVAYRFLNDYGYINFGVAPALRPQMTDPMTKETGAVIVIGAGLAGLTAARQLLKAGRRCIVLEARPNAGGRVQGLRLEGTDPMTGRACTGMAELGGSVITGTDGNPLAVLARQLGIATHHIRDKCPLFDVDGSPMPQDIDSRVFEAFNNILDQCGNWREEMGFTADGISLSNAMEMLITDRKLAQTRRERALLDWHIANLEYANAANLAHLSLGQWDQDDPYEMQGDHVLLPGGNARLIQALAEDVPIFYGKEVEEVRQTSRGVGVTVKSGEVYTADAIISTIPLGVLKTGAVRFEPELPEAKLKAIKGLGFGVLNKCAMLFAEAFWRDDLDTFGRVAESTDERGRFFLFYSYRDISGGNVLIGLVAGEAAVQFEESTEAESVARIMQVLRGIYGADIADPLRAVCTRWASDPYALGSYSHIAVGASGDDYDTMAEPFGRIFFAGEATTRRWPATMHGAMMTGLREAGNVNLALKSGKNWSGRLQGMVPKKSRPAKTKERETSVAASERISEDQRRLEEAFACPDLEFGNFAAVLSPDDNSPSAPAVLKIESGSRQASLPIYLVVTRQLVFKLLDVESGGDQARASLLMGKLGVTLFGRKGKDLSSALKCPTSDTDRARAI